MRRVAKLPQDFADLLIELCEANAEFLLIGGWAVILYGHVRATDDMDVFVRPSRSNSERVFAADREHKRKAPFYQLFSCCAGAQLHVDNGAYGAD